MKKKVFEGNHSGLKERRAAGLSENRSDGVGAELFSSDFFLF